MTIDTSAVIAILRAEPEAIAFADAITNARVRRLSAVSYLEAAVVVDATRDPIASRKLDEFFETALVTIEPVTEAQAKLARAAYRDFGKGSGHRAGLNFGDCFAYALAKSLGDRLLFKGRDFGHTDVVAAVRFQ